MDNRSITSANAEDRLAGRNFREVHEAATFLQGQACTFAARHIQDGTRRLLFNRAVSYYAREIIKDVEEGRKTASEGLKVIRAEQKSLTEQSFDVTTKAFGLGAGALQVTSGVGVCYVSVGTLCFTLGVAMIAHGTNNIYENGRNLYEGRSDVEGPVRKGYQALAELSGKQTCAGSILYGSVDLGMSAYGLTKFVTKPEAWRLFRHLPNDYIRAYKTTHPIFHAVDRPTDLFTAVNVVDQWECLK
ncbi:DUF4225 domain-containing protein [Pseudomonas sp. R1-18]|uniref:DUF4225 domain-containing protein n=1 Tax=Pseudomonas sp. R1-18 TaxID=1632772 RepID=UPI003DA7BCDF